MSEDEQHEGRFAGALREHEKFWSFIILILAVIGLVILAASFDRQVGATDLVMQAKLRIIDAAITGLLTITGMAAQALFRVSSTDKQNAITFTRALEKLPETPKAPQPVEVVNTEDKPAIVTEAAPAPDESIPEYAR